MMRENRSIRTLLACLALAVVFVSSVSVAHAAEQGREGRRGVLSFVSHFVYPVGALLDFVIVRPVQWVTDHYEPRKEQKHENCRSFRPRRACGRGR